MGAGDGLADGAAGPVAGARRAYPAWLFQLDAGDRRSARAGAQRALWHGSPSNLARRVPGGLRMGARVWCTDHGGAHAHLRDRDGPDARRDGRGRDAGAVWRRLRTLSSGDRVLHPRYLVDETIMAGTEFLMRRSLAPHAA